MALHIDRPKVPEIAQVFGCWMRQWRRRHYLELVRPDLSLPELHRSDYSKSLPVIAACSLELPPSNGSPSQVRSDQVRSLHLLRLFRWMPKLRLACTPWGHTVLR